jgi:gamma-glutamyl hercynylcysteine S-oxide synthase
MLYYRASTVLGPPLIAAYKAVTYGRHLTHLCERWADNHIDGIQQAFFNGIGFESWENVWGLWNGLTPRDAEALRRSATLLRQFARLVQHPGQFWPHVPIVLDLDSAIYASMFAADGATFSERLWLLVNRDLTREQVTFLQLPCEDMLTGPDLLKLFDVYSGDQIIINNCPNGFITVGLNMEPGGLGALLASSSPTAEDDLASFMALMRNMTAMPLAAYSSQWLPLQQELEEHTASWPTAIAPPTTASILVPGGRFRFHCFGTAIEGNRLPLGMDVQFPWEDHPQQEHDHILEVPDLIFDRYPVTNTAYQDFLSESGWRPSNEQNFLRHWNLGGTVPIGFWFKPVVWISQADARAYCNYYGGRLPHSWEWQWAAQGSDGRGWPWGANGTVGDASRMPKFSTDREMPAPDDVDAHPSGSGIQH